MSLEAGVFAAFQSHLRQLHCAVWNEILLLRLLDNTTFRVIFLVTRLPRLLIGTNMTGRKP